MPQRVTDDPGVVDNTDAHRYEIRVGSELAGLANYDVSHRSGDRIVFTHAEIAPAFEGQGLGSRLARAALDDARAQKLTVVPLCPFIAGWIRRHPEYVEAVDERHRSSVEPSP
jgi:uncharacterized protein